MNVTKEFLLKRLREKGMTQEKFLEDCLQCVKNTFQGEKIIGAVILLDTFDGINASVIGACNLERNIKALVNTVIESEKGKFGVVH